MEMEQPKKKGKGLIVFLILIIICLLGYICYDKFFNTNNNTNNNETNNVINNEPIVNTIEEVSIDSNIVTNAKKIINKLYLTEKDLYGTTKYEISKITNYDLIATALKNVSENKIAYCLIDESELKETVTYQELNEILNKLILNKTISKDTIQALTAISSYTYAQFEVNDIGIILDTNGVKLIGPCGSEGPLDFIDKKIIKAEKNNDELYIYEKQAFAKNDITEINYFKDYQKTNKIETISIDNVTDNNNLNWNSYNTYKYTFKIINNYYYFQSFELANN